MKATEHELKRNTFQGIKKTKQNESITLFPLESNFIRQIITHVPEECDWFKDRPLYIDSTVVHQSCPYMIKRSYNKT